MSKCFGVLEAAILAHSLLPFNRTQGTYMILFSTNCVFITIFEIRRDHCLIYKNRIIQTNSYNNYCYCYFHCLLCFENLVAWEIWFHFCFNVHLGFVLFWEGPHTVAFRGYSWLWAQWSLLVVLRGPFAIVGVESGSVTCRESTLASRLSPGTMFEDSLWIGLSWSI